MLRVDDGAVEILAAGEIGCEALVVAIVAGAGHQHAACDGLARAAAIAAGDLQRPPTGVSLRTRRAKRSA